MWRIAESAKQLVRQEELIARLHGEGRSTTEAEAFLGMFQEIYDAHRRDLARIDRELAAPTLPLLGD
jgi:hypothetical protein